MADDGKRAERGDKGAQVAEEQVADQLELARPARPELPPPMAERFPSAAPPPLTLVESFGATLNPPLALLVAIPASLLPAAWRRGWRLPLQLGCLLSVIGQLIFAALLGLAFVAEATRETPKLTVDSFRAIEIWQTVLVIMLAIEAMVRGVTVATDQVAGLFVLWLVEQLRTGVRWVIGAIVDGPLVIDHVVTGPGGTAVRIETCRERGWRPERTVLRYQDWLYAVVAHERRTEGPRKHVYRLDVVPAGRVIRHLVDYQPDAILPPGRRAAANLESRLRTKY